MGLLVDGGWTTEDRPRTNEGRYERAASAFRDAVTADGSSGFAAEPGRYHLYVAVNCPWAHRTWIVRKLKRLDEAIPMSIVLPRRSDQGWVFDNGSERFRDACNGASALHEVYTRARPDHTGRVTVPVLWDDRDKTIVNNESSEIIRMLNAAFDAWGEASLDLYPEALRGEIDALNERIYHTVNNGVYKAGFATTQAAYEEAFDALFATLDELEALLGRQRYLVGDRLTEADWRLFPTLARFDVAYHGAFKCNLRRLVDYPNLWAYTRELYQVPGVAETVDLEIFKRGYYSKSPLRNPTGVVPKGPEIDMSEPHGRDSLGRAAA